MLDSRDNSNYGHVILGVNISEEFVYVSGGRLGRQSQMLQERQFPIEIHVNSQALQLYNELVHNSSHDLSG